jgi:hypothetical protein
MKLKFIIKLDNISEATLGYMKEVIDKLFEPCYHYKLGTYRGKHILEDELKRYVSEKEFIDIMIEYGFVYKNGKLKARHIV